MILPTIHLNGSSPHRLAEGYKATAIAIDGAIARLRETSPNGRDYLANWELQEACTEHADRVALVQRVRADLTELVRHCEAAIEAKRAQQVGR